MSFLQGTSNPCLFLHPERRIRVWVHGDDFVLFGIHADLMWAETAIGNKIKMKRIGLLGPEPGDDKETTCMNRLLRWNVSEDRIEWECDPRHSQITIEHVGLKSDSKGVVTPGLSVHPDANSAPLSASERSVCSAARVSGCSVPVCGSNPRRAAAPPLTLQPQSSSRAAAPLQPRERE